MINVRILRQMIKMFARHIRAIDNKFFKYKYMSRGIQQNVNVANDKFTLVKIDVPWGKIEGKLWGTGDKQPLLALHGWMDNAGSFDILAPLLKNSSILAIDLPGHGLSSWLPRGIPYNEDISTEAIRVITQYFGWNKVKLLGHSMGGILSYNYAMLYPDEIEFVVSIDSLSFIPNNRVNYFDIRGKAIDKLLSYEKRFNPDPPSYSEKEAIKRWKRATVFSSLDNDAIKTLMIRGCKQKEDGTYFYTRDFRLNIEGFNNCYTSKDIEEMTHRITCPYLVLKFAQTPFFSKDIYWKTVANVLKKSSKDFRLVELNGSHHMHMIDPHPVANVINPFLEKYDI